MPRTTARRKKRQLKIVLDTNAIFTGSASDLFRREVAETIAQSSTHQDLAISWYLPEIVVHERIYQMLRRALELLPSIQKLERLLGHNLAITAAILEGRVNETVSKQLATLNCSILPLATEAVDWQRMILASAYRHPPFDPGDSEKGFRDALIVEAFAQLVAASPVTPRICSATLVTADGLVIDAATDRMKNAPNVRILETIEEVKGLINTLVAEVDEDFVNELSPRVKLYFFEKDNEETLYYRSHIQKDLKDRYEAELQVTPPGANKRTNGTWYINAPRFLKKEGQRVFWVTRIRIEASAFRTKRAGTSSDYSSLLTQLASAGQPDLGKTPLALDPTSSGRQSIQKMVAQILGSSSGPLPSAAGSGAESEANELLTTGHTVLEVTWSIAVATNGRLSSPRIEDRQHVETTWEAVG